MRTFVFVRDEEKCLDVVVDDKQGISKTKKLCTSPTTSPSSSSSKVTITTMEKTCTLRQKKYSLPGQKFDPPKEGAPLRIFYETLFKYNPESEMAKFWLMEYGLLSPEAATEEFHKKYWKEKQRRKDTSIKSLPPSSSAVAGPSDDRTCSSSYQSERPTKRSKYEDKEEPSTSK